MYNFLLSLLLLLFFYYTIISCGQWASWFETDRPKWRFDRPIAVWPVDIWQSFGPLFPFFFFIPLVRLGDSRLIVMCIYIYLQFTRNILYIYSNSVTIAVNVYTIIINIVAHPRNPAYIHSSYYRYYVIIYVLFKNIV